MIIDPIGDMLTRIKNGYMARKSSVVIPHSNVKAALLMLLTKHRYVGDMARDEATRSMSVKLLYTEGVPALTEITRVSKPGLRRYVRAQDLVHLKSGLGHIIISTPKGLKTHIEAKKDHIGGEIICKVW